ncbi:MAG: hypothetical protein U0401_28265 [Anaerolineae bacterium]
MRRVYFLFCISMLTIFWTGITMAFPLAGSSKTTAISVMSLSPTPTITPTPTPASRNIVNITSQTTLTQTEVFTHIRPSTGVIITDQSTKPYYLYADLRPDSANPVGLLDLTDPLSPVPVDASKVITQAELFYAAKSLSPWTVISGSLAYIHKGRHGLQIVDLSKSSAPQIVGYYYVPTSPWGDLLTEVAVNDYVVRTYLDKEAKLGSFEIYRSGQLIYTYYGDIFRIMSVSDITGNGIPDLVITETNAGSSGARTIGVHIFELGKRLLWLDTILTAREYNFDKLFKDLDHDGDLEILAYIYDPETWFRTVPIILRYENETYRLAPDLMHKTGSSSKEIEDLADKLRNSYWDSSAKLNSAMIELVYSGHADLAWQLYEQAWPPKIKGREKFLEQFTKWLTAEYWFEIYTMNEGKWNQWPQHLLPTPVHKMEKRGTVAVGVITDTDVYTGNYSADFYGIDEKKQGGINLQKNRVYLSHLNTLITLDVTNPSSLKRINTLTLTDTINSLAVVDSYAYLTTIDKYSPPPHGYLHVVDISNSINPVEVETVKLLNAVRETIINGNYAYLLGARDVSVLDITSPIKITEVGYYYGPDKLQSLAVLGNYIYITTGDNRLLVLDLVK